MAQEKLLLRKGLHADLVNAEKCPIIPGAISITTDEPGLYIDLAEYNADGSIKEGTKDRVRIGDVIVVPKLEDLLNSTATDAQKFSSNALYYADDKNVLCKYDKTQGKFVWINDPSSLQSSVNKINGDIIAINNAITSIQTDIGTRTANNAATKDKSIFEAIEGEYARAIQAESDLAQEIATIKGESGSAESLKKLREDLTAEEQARSAADVTLQNNINAHKTTLEQAIAAEAKDRADADAQIKIDFAKADDDLKAELKKYINDNLAIADAMTFKGTVSYKTGSTTELNLPTGTEVDADGNKILIQAGDTYVVSTNLHDTEHEYHAGDMLIAKADQGADDATYTGGWEHVKTGYDVAHESKLSVDNNTNKINLTSHVGSNLGSVEFTSSSSNLVINKTSGNEGAINFDLVWTTF